MAGLIVVSRRLALAADELCPASAQQGHSLRRRGLPDQDDSRGNQGVWRRMEINA
jgi:hypothetical protein